MKSTEAKLLNNLSRNFKRMHVKRTPMVFIYSAMIASVKKDQVDNGPKPYHKELINNLWSQACTLPVMIGGK